MKKLFLSTAILLVMALINVSFADGLKHLQTTLKMETPIRMDLLPGKTALPGNTGSAVVINL